MGSDCIACRRYRDAPEGLRDGAGYFLAVAVAAEGAVSPETSARTECRRSTTAQGHRWPGTLSSIIGSNVSVAFWPISSKGGASVESRAQHLAELLVPVTKDRDVLRHADLRLDEAGEQAHRGCSRKSAISAVGRRRLGMSGDVARAISRPMSYRLQPACVGALVAPEPAPGQPGLEHAVAVSAVDVVYHRERVQQAGVRRSRARDRPMCRWPIACSGWLSRRKPRDGQRSRSAHAPGTAVPICTTGTPSSSNAVDELDVGLPLRVDQRVARIPSTPRWRHSSS